MFYMYIYIWYSNIHPLYKTEKGATVILCLVTYSFWFNKHINHDDMMNKLWFQLGEMIRW
jgi:hypothetical protein